MRNFPQGHNAWDNGSWVRTKWDNIREREREEWEKTTSLELLAAQQRSIERSHTLATQVRQELEARKRYLVLSGPERAMKQYRNALRKVGLMAVAEALG